MTEHSGPLDHREMLRLRAEWLKTKGYVHDPITGLPTLPAVIEEVRRRIESGERVGAVYLDMQNEEQLESIYGWETYDGLIQQVATAIQSLFGGPLKASDVIALRAVRSDEFLLFLTSEGREHFDERTLRRLRDRIVHELSMLLQIEVGFEGPRGLGLHTACAMLGYDPTMRIERIIYKTVDEIKDQCRRERAEQITARLAELRRILSSEDIRVRYQPIVWLGDRRIFGFEALSGGPAGHLFENSEMLFSFAEKTDQIRELERLCRLQSLRGATQLSRGRKLFLNTSVHSVEDTEFFTGPVAEEAERIGIVRRDIVLEITERVAVTSWQSFRRHLADLRHSGFAVAIDDMGAGYSSLHTVAEIEPDYLKFDISLVRDIHLSPIKQDLLGSLVDLARKIDAKVIAEGVEKAEEYVALREMGVTFGQGYYFARPGTVALDSQHPVEPVAAG
jgi:EAL domain-containing protein (putative c-di-GMP-specific phosphodiesterase class I)/GGDEF domain-containing protein